MTEEQLKIVSTNLLESFPVGAEPTMIVSKAIEKGMSLSGQFPSKQENPYWFFVSGLLAMVDLVALSSFVASGNVFWQVFSGGLFLMLVGLTITFSVSLRK